jgi:hypothetical protein
MSGSVRSTVRINRHHIIFVSVLRLLESRNYPTWNLSAAQDKIDINRASRVKGPLQSKVYFISTTECSIL